MKGIIPMARFQKKKEKEEREWMELDKKMDAFERAVAVDEKTHTAESVMTVLAAMNGLSRAMVNNPFGRYVVREQKKREEDFNRKYKDVFDSAPDMPVARIKYFCRVLWKIWQEIERRDWQDRYSIYDDFCSVYMEGVDKAFSDWCKIDHKTDEMADEVQDKYPFLQLEVTKDNMGTLLSETLDKIISICPEVGDAIKKDFLWELVRLFEICRGILYVFADKVDAASEARNL